MMVPFPTMVNVGEDLRLERKIESSGFRLVKFEMTEKARAIEFRADNKQAGKQENGR